jgi:hypothetical protein
MFVHPLVRAAVYDDLSLTARAALHTVAADHTSGSVSLQHRVAAAVGNDEQLAADLAAGAAHELADGAVAVAAGHLIAASRLTSAAGLREQRLVDAVRLLLLAGDAPRALGLTAAVGELPDGARRRFALGHFAILEGRRQDGQVLLQGAWDVLDRTVEPELAAQLGGELSQLAILEGRPVEGERWARHALEAVNGDVARAAGVMSRLMTALAHSGRAGQALALVSDVAEQPAPSTLAQVDTLMGRAMVRLWADDLIGSRRDLIAVTTALHDRAQVRDGPACASVKPSR